MNQAEVWSYAYHNLEPSHFAEGLEHNDKRIRKLVAKRIAVMRDINLINDLINALAREHCLDVEYEMITALGRLGEPAISALIKGLTDKNENVRRVAAISLGDIGCVESIDDLCAATEDKSSLVRRAAIRALGNTCVLTDEVEEKVLTRLNDEDESVIITAAFSAGNLGCTNAVPRLLSLLDSINPRYKGFIVENLGNVGDNRATEKLCQMLVISEDTSGTDFSIDTSKLGDVIVKALGEIADPRAIQLLIKALIYCVTFDEDAQQGDGTETDAEKCEHEQPDILWSIHTALIQIGEPAILPLIETLKEWAVTEECDEDSPDCTCCQSPSVASEISFILSKLGNSVIGSVLELLGDKNVKIRKIVVNTLYSDEFLGDPRVFDALVDCLIKDPDKEVRMLAASVFRQGGLKGFDAIVHSVVQLHRPFTMAEKRAIREICHESIASLASNLTELDEGRRVMTLTAIRELIKISEE